MIPSKEIHVLDRNAEYFGVPTIELMEAAGKGVAEFVTNTLKPQQKRILVLCGTGNNGGDGFVAARYLAKTHTVSVILVGENIKTELSQTNFDTLQKMDLTIHTMITDIDQLLEKHDIIIDAMLGIGIYGSLREPFVSLVQKINNLRGKAIVAVDVPTGLGTPHAIRPEYTVTFHDVKEGMARENSGEIHVVDIGIPKEAQEYVGPGELAAYYPKPQKDSHKGENGSVLIIGGGPYVGAPALAGMAALRTGADLTFIATPKRSWQAIASFSPNLIVCDLNSDVLTPGDIPIIRDLIPRCTAVAIGPGLGSAKETEDTVLKIVQLALEKQKPLVIDADAISPIGKHLEIIQNSGDVFTPHAGEFKELTGISLSKDTQSRSQTVTEQAKKLGVSIFLKGPVDVLSNGIATKLNRIHNEAMTVGGTGDVLTGIIAALLSKGVEPFNAMRIAAFLNGEAGNEAFAKKSYGLLPTDIVEEIPSILKKYL